MGKRTDGTTATLDGTNQPMSLFDLADVPSVLNLAEKFTVPPFSLLMADGGWWQDRKRQWKDIGIRSEEGRDVRAYGSDKDQSDLGRHIDSISGGQSIFDPVVTELSYRWFCPPGGLILDPFAGGSVRGAVAAFLGYNYHGIDLSQRQIEANYANMIEMQDTGQRFPGSVQWTHGDSLLTIPEVAEPESQDFLFSCPPYFDLEIYSDGAGDISAMTWPDFLTCYRGIIDTAVSALKNDRFAIFVVTEIRDKKTGMYRNFVGETVQAFIDAGMYFYNDSILATPVGSVAQMAERQFRASRKIGRRHQNVLCFVKGDPRVAAELIEG